MVALQSGVYIRFCGNGHLGFRPDGGSLLKSAKVSKTLLPHHLAPRLGSVCPHSGIAPWAAAKGHPWPSAAIPASMPGCPLRNACVRTAWFNGASRSRSKARARARARARAGHAGIYVAEPPLSRASSLPHWIFRRHNIYVYPEPPVGASLLAKRPAHPTSSLTGTPSSRASFAPTDLMGVRPQEPGRLLGRLAVDVDLGRPVNHAG